jgi:hypothetical protein
MRWNCHFNDAAEVQVHETSGNVTSIRQRCGGRPLTRSSSHPTAYAAGGLGDLPRLRPPSASVPEGSGRGEVLAAIAWDADPGHLAMQMQLFRGGSGSTGAFVGNRDVDMDVDVESDCLRECSSRASRSSAPSHCAEGRWWLGRLACRLAPSLA